MADTRAATGLVVKQWEDRFFKEYLQESVFTPYAGTSETSIIQMQQDLTKKKGDKIAFSLVNKLSNAAVLGSTTLKGNEEDLASRSFELEVNQRRNGVVVSVMEEQKSAIGLREAARAVLKDWVMTDLRDQIIDAMWSIDGVSFRSTSAAQRNTWVTNNADRAQFGALASNYSATFATAMATLDNTNDIATANTVDLAKRRALMANPKIRPIQVMGGKRVLVAFCHPLVFRNLQQSLQTVNRDAWDRGRENPIFTGADLHYQGVVFKEVDDMPLLAANETIGGVAIGNTVQASPLILCGAQAIGHAIAMRSNFVTDEDDYKDKQGVAVREIRGVGKMRFGTGADDTTTPKDHGVYTLWLAAPADA